MSGKQNYSRITQAPGCCEERIAISTRGKAIKSRRAAPEHLTSARPMDIDLSSVERLLTAIDEDCIPTGLDKEGLLSGLRSCLATYFAALERSSDRPRRERIRKLERVAVAASRFRVQLHSEALSDLEKTSCCDIEHLRQEFDSFFHDLNSRLDDLRFDLKWGPDFFEAIELRKGDPRAYADRWKAYSPLEWLAGHYLPELFRKHFGGAPTIYRKSDQALDGPMLIFIEKAIDEFKVIKDAKAYSRESIVRAIGQIRSGHRRRKPPTYGWFGQD